MAFQLKGREEVISITNKPICLLIVALPQHIFSKFQECKLKVLWNSTVDFFSVFFKSGMSVPFSKIFVGSATAAENNQNSKTKS